MFFVPCFCTSPSLFVLFYFMNDCSHHNTQAHEEEREMDDCSDHNTQAREEEREEDQHDSAPKNQPLESGGIAPFGNFHQYYQFNPVQQRLCRIPAELSIALAQVCKQVCVCVSVCVVVVVVVCVLCA